MFIPALYAKVFIFHPNGLNREKETNMKKILFCLAFLLVPSTVLADIAPIRDMPCEECIFRCFDCCTMQEIAPMPGCGSCYRSSCDFGSICADYLSKNPDRCPERRPQDNQDKPALNGDENAQNDPEINEPEQVQTETGAIAAQPQVPPPVETKRSCSAMIMAPGQSGGWALLIAIFLGFSAFVMRRQSR